MKIVRCYIVKVFCEYDRVEINDRIIIGPVETIDIEEWERRERWRFTKDNVNQQWSLEDIVEEDCLEKDDEIFLIVKSKTLSEMDDFVPFEEQERIRQEKLDEENRIRIAEIAKKYGITTEQVMKERE